MSRERTKENKKKIPNLTKLDKKGTTISFKLKIYHNVNIIYYDIIQYYK